LDRAGITGDDGPSHHGVWDLALLSSVPGLRIAAPRDGTRLRELLREAFAVSDGPTAVRYPKGSLPPDVPSVGSIGAAEVLARGARPDVLILAVGPTAPTAIEAVAALGRLGVEGTVLDPRWIKPLDHGLCAVAAQYRAAIVLEDGVGPGGVADALSRALASRTGSLEPVIGSIAVPARFIPHGDRAAILAELGLTDVDRLVDLALHLIGRADAPRAVRPAPFEVLEPALAADLSAEFQ
jgi:1-deoxy-D-xylulose-5-phosphate synthase